MAVKPKFRTAISDGTVEFFRRRILSRCNKSHKQEWSAAC